MGFSSDFSMVIVFVLLFLLMDMLETWDAMLGLKKKRVEEKGLFSGGNY